ncbi:MAG: peptidoglycan editing factor PgeF [Actinomycetaceae bacterium]|nr:peptidoglycan editing factor PgeF [Actinomycetaceae bacterium]
MTPTTTGIQYRFTRCVTDPAVAGEALSIPNYGLNTDAPSQLVMNDRRELAQRLGMPILWMRQTHSDVVEVVDGPISSHENSVTADAVITRSRMALAVQVADCVPVLLWDEKTGTIGAVHAGRAGVEKAIVAKAVSTMAGLGCSTSDIVAAVGPCICPKCYEVGQDVYDALVAKRPEVAARTSWDTLSVDIRAGVVKDLENSGVTNIIQDDACTFESAHLNSYRRNPRCGRQIGLVAYV